MSQGAVIRVLRQDEEYGRNFLRVFFVLFFQHFLVLKYFNLLFSLKKTVFGFFGGRGVGMGVTGKINSIFKAGLLSNFRRTACPPAVDVSKFYLARSAVQFLALLFLKISVLFIRNTRVQVVAYCNLRGISALCSLQPQIQDRYLTRQDHLITHVITYLIGLCII